MQSLAVYITKLLSDYYVCVTFEKSRVKKVVQFIVYNYLLVALGAVAMFYQTDRMLNDKLHSVYYYLFVFFATLFSYHVYYLKNTKTKTHYFFSLVSSLLAVFSYFKIKDTVNNNLLFIIFILSALYILTSFYKEKKVVIAFFKVLTLISVWFLTTIVLPFNSLNEIVNYWTYCLYQFIFYAIICFHFFIKDEIEDSKKSKYILVIIAINLLMLFFSIITIFFTPFVLLFNILFLAISVKIYFQEPSHFFYLVALDGLLLLQSIFVLLNWYI